MTEREKLEAIRMICAKYAGDPALIPIIGEVLDILFASGRLY